MCIGRIHLLAVMCFLKIFLHCDVYANVWYLYEHIVPEIKNNSILLWWLGHVERKTEEDAVMRKWKWTPKDRKIETEVEWCYKKIHEKGRVQIEEAQYWSKISMRRTQIGKRTRKNVFTVFWLLMSAPCSLRYRTTSTWPCLAAANSASSPFWNDIHTDH